MEDLTNLGKLITREHEKKWIAISKDYKHVVSFNENLKELQKEIGDVEVLYMKVPPSDVYLTF